MELQAVGSTDQLKGEQMAVGSTIRETKERVEGTLLVAIVVLVQIGWGATLLYLGVRFL